MVHNTSISESMIMTILHLIKFTTGPPHVHLSFLISPYFERTSKKEIEQTSENSQYNASRLALLRNGSIEFINSKSEF